MPVELRIEGARNLEKLSKKLKAAGDATLRKELYAGINRATKPAKTAIKEAARRELPKKGGLNEFIAKSSVTTRTRGGGKNPGVQIVAKKKGHDIRAIDRGRLRHPVWGNRRVWVTQQIKPGFFTDTIGAQINDLRRAVIKVLDDIARKVAG